MATVVFPAEWGVLKHPHVRWELLGELAELADPTQTARWLALGQKGPIIGFDQTVHFFFDDHDFHANQVGYSLFDDEEVGVVRDVVAAIDRIITPRGPFPSNREALKHAAWPEVEAAARVALDHLGRRGSPVIDENDT